MNTQPRPDNSYNEKMQERACGVGESPYFGLSHLIGADRNDPSTDRREHSYQGFGVKYDESGKETFDGMHCLLFTSHKNAYIFSSNNVIFSDGIYKTDYTGKYDALTYDCKTFIDEKEVKGTCNFYRQPIEQNVFHSVPDMWICDYILYTYTRGKIFFHEQKSEKRFFVPIPQDLTSPRTVEELQLIFLAQA